MCNYGEIKLIVYLIELKPKNGNCTNKINNKEK